MKGINRKVFILVILLLFIMVIIRGSRIGYNLFSLEVSSDDLRLLKLYISHHGLVDYRGNLVSPRMFFHSLVRSWIDDELYSFKCGLGLGSLDLEDLENGK